MEPLRLLRFRVTGFRSVRDSGWIEADRITSLIGANEAGKTNLLYPLWKLKPANEGEINALADMPRKEYNTLRSASPKPVFIEAIFEVPEATRPIITGDSDVEEASVAVVSVSRDYDGKYHVTFPEDRTPRAIGRASFNERIAGAKKALAELAGLKKPEAQTRDRVVALLDSWTKAEGAVVSADLVSMRTTLDEIGDAEQTGAVSSRIADVAALLDELSEAIDRPRPAEVEEVRTRVIQNLPAFVYYSNYGNLDSEIYLPHVIANLKRKDIQGKEAAKARTLRVLFEFVRLKAEEILSLGEEGADPAAQAQAEIDKVAARKKEREVLLQSASAHLTAAFRDWWKQGDYRFRFQADGRHFRIWVSDDQRPEEVELEGRSTGLQWFLSFYLVFLVESREAHKGAILLLDEPGLSLHPVAQRDLARFFESLSSTNQLVYTTHSPFLVDPDHLDRVRAVFVDEKGYTVASPDLRVANKATQARSIYAVHASIGLTASEGLLLGCQPIIVEGPSDQIFMGLMKIALIRESLIAPAREVIFLPSGGVKGVKQVTTVVLGRDEELPFVALDGDRPGRDMAAHLRDGKDAWYATAKERVVLATDVLVGGTDTEFEDLFASKFLVPIISKAIRGPSEDFEDFYVQGSMNLVPSVEAWAKKHGHALPEGWKVDVARAAKQRALRTTAPVAEMEAAPGLWLALFSKLGVERRAPKA